jgi:hypothetical protein
MIFSTTPALPLKSRIREAASPSSRLWSGARVTLAVIAFCFAALSAHAEALRLAPSYKAAGKNADGSSYTGTVTVKIISDTTFTIEWKIGDSVLKGFGMRQGDTLAATYMLAGQPGLVIYRVEDGGTLRGTWAIKGESGTGSETLTPR